MQISIPQINGFNCFCSNGSSYNCPALKLFGFSSERTLTNAIKKKVKAQNKVV